MDLSNLVSNGQNITISDNQGQGEIVNDDVPTITCPGDIVQGTDDDDCNTEVTIPYQVFDTNWPTARLKWTMTGAMNDSGDGQIGNYTFGLGETTITYEAYDDISTNYASCSFKVTVIDDVPPVWLTSAGNLDRSVYCGQITLLNAAQELAPEAKDNCSGVDYIKISGVFVPGGPNGAGTYTNTWIATDASGNISSVFTQTITVLGVTIDASASSQATLIDLITNLSGVVTLSATVTDANDALLSGVYVKFELVLFDELGIEEVVWEDDTETVDGIAEVTVSGLAVNLYQVRVTAGSGCDEDVAYLSVADPSAGFVTGGGWINSPEGALVGTTIVGKANFGFNAQYKKGKEQRARSGRQYELPVLGR